MQYSKDTQKFLKIFVVHPQMVSRLRQIIEGGFSINGRDILSEITYESNLPYALRFMVDNNIGGMTWVRIDKKKWQIRSHQKKETHCQIEFDVYNYNDVKSLPCEGQYSKLAPLRILSFDIECSAEKGRFPQPKTDPVIQIANIVKIYGESEVFVRNVFTLDDCAPIVGSKVFSFKKEDDMLQRWRDFVRQVDPDVITGYNIVNFDFPYLIERADFLKIPRFPMFSRIFKESRIKSTTLSSKALGTRDSKEINIEGRV